jgi:hypothetical protein
MATVIKIKRSSGTTAPSALAQGELALTYGTGTAGNNGDRLFIGTGTETAGEAANIDIIGGKYFADLNDHTHGTLTASSTIIVDSNKAIDELFVGNSATIGGQVKLNEGTNNGSNFIGIKAPNSVTTTTTFVLPDGDGTSGQFIKTDGSGNLSFDTVTSSLTLAADSGSNDTINTGETLTFTGGEGIDTAVADNSITISAENASDSNKGVASFDATDFTVSTGNVTLNAERIQDITGLMFSSNTETLITATYQDSDGTIDLVVDDDLANYSNANSDFATVTGTETLTNKTISGSSNTLSNIANSSLTNSTITLGSSTLTLGATTTAIAGMTQLTVDNIDVNGNTISTTDANGDLVLSPNGSGAVSVNSSKITNVVDPTSAQDAATKAYVDAIAEGLHVHASCKAATTQTLAAESGDTVTYDNGVSGVGATLTLSTGITTLDSYTLVNGDRLLIKNESNAAHNGIYIRTSSTVLTRATDFDTTAEIASGDFLFVEEGTVNANNGYVQTETTSTIGTSDIIFEQFSGAGQVIAGAALSKTGNTLDVEVDDSSIEVSSDALQVKALGITNAMLAGSIANAKLVNSAITVTDGSTSTSTSLGGTITFTAGEGMDVTESSGTLTFAGEDATTSNKGIASFSSDNFTVSSGAVTVTTIDGGTY